MKKFAITLALLFLAGSAHAEVMRDTFVGCKNTKDMSRIVRLLGDGDREAFGKFATQKVMNGECMIISSGAEVRLEDASILSGRACVRPRGEPDCYYIPLELIMD